MKKLTALLLVILLVVSSISCLWLSTAAADTPTLEEYVETPANWTFDQGTGEGTAATTIGSTMPIQTCTAVNDTTVVLPDSTQSLKIKAPNTFASIGIGDYIKKNRHYKLTVNYQVEKRDGNGRSFASIGLFTPNVADASLKDNNDYVVRASGDWSYYFDASGTQVWTTSTINTKLDAADCGTWCSIIFEFYSKDYTDLTLVIDSHNWGNVYLDGMQLTDLSAGTQAFDEYVKDPANWTIDKDSATTIGSTTPPSYVTKSTDTTKVVEGRAASLKFYAPDTYSTVDISEYLEQGKHYQLTLTYYFEKDFTGTFHIGVMAPKVTDAKLGGNCYAVNASRNWNYYYNTKTFDASQRQWSTAMQTTGGAWHTVTLDIYTFDYEALTMVIRGQFWGNFYIGDATLTEVVPPAESYYEDATNWEFDPMGATTIGNTTTLSAPAKRTVKTDAKVGSQVLKVTASNHYASIALPDNLKANQKYTLSFWYNADSLGSENDITSAIKTIGIYSPGTSGASFSWANNAYVSQISYNGDFINTSKTDRDWSKSSFRTCLTEDKLNSWQKAEITFNSFDFTDLHLVLYLYTNNVLLDGFDLIETLPTPDSYYETPDNWRFNTDAATTIDDSAKAAKASQNSEVVVSGKQSLLIEQPYQHVWIPLAGIAPNKHYRLSFRYHLNALGSASESFERIGIYAPDHAGASFLATKPGFISYAQHDTSYYWENDNFEGDPVWTAEDLKTKLTQEDLGTWQTISFEFYTHSYTNLALVFKTAATKLYLDGFELVNADPVTTAEYFETPTNWKFENGDSKALGVDPVTWATATTATDPVKEGESSLKLNAPYQHAYIAMPKGLNPDSKYKLTFWQYSDTLGYDDQLDDGKRYYHVLRTVSIYTPDVEDAQIGWATAGSISGLSFNGDYVMSDGNAAWNANGNKLELKTGDVGKWHQVSISFETADYENIFLIFKTNVTPLYVDGFTLSEVPHHESVYNGSDRELVIDFEADYPYFSATKNGHITVDKTKGMDGKITRAMHINERLYDPENQNVTFNNWALTWSNTDPVFTFPVNGNAAYTMSLKMRVDEWKNMDSTKKLIIYYNYPGNEKILDSYIAEYCGDGWVELSVDFITDPDEKWISFGIDTANAHPDIWVDDIVLRQHMRGYNGETNKNYCEDFFNLIDEASFAISGTITKAVTVEIPARAITRYTLGVDMSGAGKLVLSYDKEQTDVIHTIAVSGAKKRYSACVMTGETDSYIYLTFKPEGKGITYDALHFFMTKAISFGYDLGYDENPNFTKSANYTLVYYGADGKPLSGQSQSAMNSPATGDTPVIPILLVLIGTAAAILVLCRKRKFC